MSYQQLTPELTQKIINEAVNSNLSSYQIAFKYSITKSVVNRLCRQHLGSEIYNKRESLSFDYLASQIKGLRQKKYSSDRVAQALGLYKTTCFTLIKKIELEDFTSNPSSDDKVNVISVPALSVSNESSKRTSNLKQSASPKTVKLTKELPLVPEKIEYEVPVEDDTPHEDENCEVSRDTYAPYHRRKPYFNRKNSFDRNRHYREQVKINVKGMQISFNASDEVAGTVVMKLLKELGTEE